MKLYGVRRMDVHFHGDLCQESKCETVYLATEADQLIASLRDQLKSAQRDAERYRWLRTAGAWESEIGMDELSKDPAKFDAAVDSALKEQTP